MNKFELMTSGFFSGEENGYDISSHNELQRMMEDNALTSIEIDELTAVAIMESYRDLKNEVQMLSSAEQSKIITKELKLPQKFMQSFYDSVEQEKVIVSSNGDLSIVADIKDTGGVSFAMDSDSGAKNIAMMVSATALNFVENKRFSQVFLCDNAIQAKDIMNRLDSGDDSIFDESLRARWIDNEGDIWLMSDTDDSAKYAVGTSKELFNVNGKKAIQVKRELESNSELGC